MSGHLPALHVTRNLPPLKGGMERLNARIAAALAHHHRLGVVGPAGCATLLDDQIDVMEAPLRPLSSFLFHAALLARRWAADNHPAIVFAGSGLTAPIVWLAAPRGSLRVVYVHGLDLVVESLIYRLIWLPFLRGCDLVLANSTNTARLAAVAGISQERIRVLHPGTELPAADAQAAREFRERFGLGDRRVLLSVGRLTPRKGLCSFVEYALPALVRTEPGLLLLVIGDDPGDALNTARGSERERVAAAADRAGVADALRFLPHCDDTALSAAYQACDLHLFPVREIRGDVEGFGMVAIEAAAHGLPTLGFRSGGVPDAVVEGVTGELVAEGDFAALAARILDWLPRCREQAVREACRSAAARWSWDVFERGLRESLDEAMGMAGRPR